MQAVELMAAPRGAIAHVHVGGGVTGAGGQTAGRRCLRGGLRGRRCGRRGLRVLRRRWRVLPRLGVVRRRGILRRGRRGLIDAFDIAPVDPALARRARDAVGDVQELADRIAEHLDDLAGVHAVDARPVRRSANVHAIAGHAAGIERHGARIEADLRGARLSVQTGVGDPIGVGLGVAARLARARLRRVGQLVREHVGIVLCDEHPTEREGTARTERAQRGARGLAAMHGDVPDAELRRCPSGVAALVDRRRLAEELSWRPAGSGGVAAAAGRRREDAGGRADHRAAMRRGARPRRAGRRLGAARGRDRGGVLGMVAHAVDAAHERARECVRLELVVVVGLTDPQHARRRPRRAARLHGVRDLVRDQLDAIAARRCIPTAAEEQVLALREGARADGLRRGVGVGSGVDPDVVESSAERRLEIALQPALERYTAAARVLHERRRTGIDVGALGAAHEREPHGSTAGRRARGQRHPAGGRGAGAWHRRAPAVVVARRRLALCVRARPGLDPVAPAARQATCGATLNRLVALRGFAVVRTAQA